MTERYMSSDSDLMHMDNNEIHGIKPGCTPVMCQGCSGCEYIEPIGLVLEWQHTPSDTVSVEKIEQMLSSLSSEFAYSGVQITYISTPLSSPDKDGQGHFFINGVPIEELVKEVPADGDYDIELMRSALFTALKTPGLTGLAGSLRV